MAVLLLWSLIPVYWIVVTSFKHEQEIYAYPPTFIPFRPTLEQYAMVLFHTPFPLFIRNSFIVAACATLLSCHRRRAGGIRDQPHALSRPRDGGDG